MIDTQKAQRMFASLSLCVFFLLSSLCVSPSLSRFQEVKRTREIDRKHEQLTNRVYNILHTYRHQQMAIFSQSLLLSCLILHTINQTNALMDKTKTSTANIQVNTYSNSSPINQLDNNNRQVTYQCCSNHNVPITFYHHMPLIKSFQIT